MSTSRRTVVAGITASPLAFGQALPAFAQKKIVLGFSQIGAERKKINVLYAHNDDMAIGVIQAIEEAGLKPSKDITIIAVDAGKLDVSVECCPVLGPQLMAAAKEFPTRTY
jgi:ABC-type xylose transport system substrate-binding protein